MNGITNYNHSLSTFILSNLFPSIQQFVLKVCVNVSYTFLFRWYIIYYIIIQKIINYAKFCF